MPSSRIAAHCTRDWYPLVDHSRTTIEWHSSRELAAAAESAAIVAEGPLFNRNRGDGRRESSPRLYDSSRDLATWERLRQEAHDAGESMTRHLVSVIRKHHLQMDRTAKRRQLAATQRGEVAE